MRTEAIIDTALRAKEREKFLADRQTGIGGSDVAAILGISPWSTPLDVYHQKLGLDETEETFAMRRGTLLEPLILDEFERSIGTKVHPGDEWGMMRHYNHEWMLAHIDGAIVIGAPALPGEKVTYEGVEAKSASSFTPKDDWGPEGTDDIPAHYMTQVQWYLAVTGWKRWHLSVWFGTDEKRDYVIDRDEDMIEGLIEVCQAFWFKNVLPQVPPAPINLTDQKRMWPRPEKGKAIELTIGLQYHIGCIAEFQAVVKKAKDEIEQHQFELQEAMGEDADCIVPFGGGKPVTTWKRIEPTPRLDTKRIKDQESPEFLETYMKPSKPYRKFYVTAAGKKLGKPEETNP